MQDASEVSLGILVDRRKNQEFIQEDDTFRSYVYDANYVAGILRVQLASKAIMDVWKGDGLIRIFDHTNPGFEDAAQFAPVFLVADMTNNGVQAVQVTGAYLAVQESASDLQPYLTIDSEASHCGHNGRFDPVFELRNYGWGQVRNASLIYSFGTSSVRTQSFIGDLGSFDGSVQATVAQGFRAAGADVNRLQAGGFRCSSNAAVPACLARLERTGIFGDVAGRFWLSENKLVTNVTGRIEYTWLGSDGRSNQRASPFSINVPVMFFDTGIDAECGAPSPVDRSHRPIELSLDRREYRIPLNVRTRLTVRENRRYGLTLVAAKSSRHIFALVLELADGRTIRSPVVDLSYFRPRMPLVATR